tara:strand:- start:3049 stop:3531 length:483 start_codon:yes stop_codon:yes gene_type:complete
MPKHFPSFDVNNWRRWEQRAERLLKESAITLTGAEIMHHMKPVHKINLEKGEIYFALHDIVLAGKVHKMKGMRMVYVLDNQDTADEGMREDIKAIFIRVRRPIEREGMWRIYGYPSFSRKPSSEVLNNYYLIISWTDLLKIGETPQFINWIDDSPFEVKS